MQGLKTGEARVIPLQTDLVAAAAKLAPNFAARAAQTEADRRLSKETMAELFQAGLLRYFVPHRYGGYEMDWGVQVGIGRALARACASTAWIACVVGSHSAYIGRMDEKAQDDVWSDSPDRLVATGSVMRNVSVETLPHGYRLSGRWSFSSGIDHAQWVLLRASPTGDHRQSYFLMPREVVRIEDDWHVSGMSGTGSNTVVIENAEIPAYRVLSLSELMAPNPPGSKVNSGYLYSASFRPFAGSALLGPILGGAEAVLHEFRELMRQSESDRKDAQCMLRLAEASAEVSAAERIIETIVQRQLHYAKSGARIPKPERIAMVHDRTFAARLCYNSSARLVVSLKPLHLLKDAPIQRHFRDLSAMLQQIGVNWDRNMLNCAKAMFDMPTDIPDLNAD